VGPPECPLNDIDSSKQSTRNNNWRAAVSLFFLIKKIGYHLGRIWHQFVKNQYNTTSASRVCKERRGEKKMKTTHKQLVGGLLIGVLLTSVAAAFATAENDTTTTTTGTQPPQLFGGRFSGNETGNTTTGGCPRIPMGIMIGPYSSLLTDEQRTELEDLMTSLREQNATPEDMRTAIQEKLDEFGVLDTQLDNEITQTEQRLTILNREKDLRSQGYSWDEITTIIADEFGSENATGVGWDMMSGPGFRHGPHGAPQGPMESDDLTS
jgi:hypothetical protein